MSRFTYEDYKKKCQCLGFAHTMTEAQFNGDKIINEYVAKTAGLGKRVEPTMKVHR